jgi:hypothetical protein
MKTTCKMYISDFFKLSTGHVALVGKLVPDIEKFIPKSKADLYVSGQKIKTINIIGEDRFSGVDEKIRQGNRAIRTDDDIISDMNTKPNQEIKLIIYIT